MSDSPSNPRAGTNYMVSGILAMLASGVTAIIVTTLTLTTLKITEQAAPALSASGSATIYADSTAHSLKISENGGAYAAIPTGSIPSAANPSQSIDGSVHNGVAATFLRSDAAPAIASGAALTSPVLTTPSLGVAIATSINGNTFTTGTYTLTGVAGKTLTFNKNLTFEGTDGTTMTFPSTSATIARTDAANTFTGASNATSWNFTTPVLGTVTSGNISACTSTSMVMVTPVLGTPTSGNLSNCTALSLATGGASVIAPQYLTETTTTASGYTLLLTDDYKVVTVNTAGANTLNIPTNASVAFPVGTQITVIQKGAGQWTIAATTPGTTTVVSNGGTAASPKLRVQYSAATLWKDATDHWYVTGDIQ